MTILMPHADNCGGERRALNIERPTSNTEHRAPNIEHRTLNIERPTRVSAPRMLGRPKSSGCFANTEYRTPNTEYLSGFTGKRSRRQPETLRARRLQPNTCMPGTNNSQLFSSSLFFKLSISQKKRFFLL